jgi:sulfur carrier protein ThiS
MSRRKDEYTIKVARVPGKAVEVVLNGDHTVKDALQAAGFSKKDSEEIRVNSVDREMDYDLKDGDRVTLVRHIEGGAK